MQFPFLAAFMLNFESTRLSEGIMGCLREDVLF